MTDDSSGGFRTLGQLLHIPRPANEARAPMPAPALAIVPTQAAPQRPAITEPERDRALILRWVPDSDWLARINFPMANHPDTATIEAAILAAAYTQGRSDPARWLAYSRRTNWYAENRPALPDAVSYRTMTAAVDRLADLGLIEHQKAKPSSRSNRESVLRAAPMLLDRAAPARAQILPMRETILLRTRSEDGRGERIGRYTDTAQTEQWRRNVATINEALASVRVDLAPDAPGVVRDGVLLRVGGLVFCPAVCRVHRIFNGDWKHGGRFYADGRAWQGLSGPPKRTDTPRPHATRADLTINGEAVAEHDYDQIHPRLLYALACLPLDRDAYTVSQRLPGFADRWDQRAALKRTFNAMLNCYRGGRAGAVAAMALELAGGEKYEVTAAHYAKAKMMVEAMEARHPALVETGRFYTGLGLRLQKIDADIAERVMLALIERGIVALPVHDSMIVQARHTEAMIEVMDAELDRTLDDLRGRKIFPGSAMQTTA